MAFFHHGSIRKYTASLLAFFNDIEIQYKISTGEKKIKKVPLNYSTREKSKILDNKTTEQLLNGNYNVLPRANLSLVSMAKSDARITNKNNKINTFKNSETMQFSYNSVPYEFIYDITVMCRGMNEATQIIEQIAPKFNPTVNIDIWDAENLTEPTRVPVKLVDVSIESDEYDELSTNTVSVIFGLSLTGNLYPPVMSMPRVKEFQMYLNQIENEEEATRQEMLEWDVGLDGKIISGGLDIYSDELVAPPGYTGEQVLDPDDVKTTVPADQVTVTGLEGQFTSTTIEGILQEIAEHITGATDEGNTIDTLGYVTGSGTFDEDGNVDVIVEPRLDIYLESLDHTAIIYADGVLTDYVLTGDNPRPINKIAYIEYGVNATDPLISLAYDTSGRILRTDYYRDRSTFTLDGSGRDAYTDYNYNNLGKLDSSNFYEV